MADPMLEASPRSATLFAAATIASAAVSGSAAASPISPAVQKAFDAWQAANAVFEVCCEASTAALNRYEKIEPDEPEEKILATVPNSTLRSRLSRIGIMAWPPMIEEALTSYMAWAAVELQVALDAANSYIAAVEAANEMSGLKAAEADTDAAHDAKEAAFDRFLGVEPQNMADVRLQAKHLKDWLHDCSVEAPQMAWLEAVTGEAWPDYCSDEASKVEAA